MIPRLYLSLQFFPLRSIPLSAPHHHYLAHVLRLPPQAEVHIFNGSQGLWKSSFQENCLLVQQCIEDQPCLRRSLSLFFSPIKQQNWLIEKATELGVTHFVPILCQRTVVRHFSQERHQKISWEACEQSHRLDIPQFSPLTPLAQTLSSLSSGQYIVLDPKSDVALNHFSHSEIDGFFIGPEGGWSPEELVLFEQAPCIKRVHMGPLILRAETAALACASFIQIGSLAPEL